jgi:serine/threonine-protein kinase mTOR
MKVLRDNKESLMAVLEAFVYDPLITWRLIQHDGDSRRAERTYGVSFCITKTDTEGILVMNPDRNVDLVGSAAEAGGTAHRRMRPDENDIFNGTCGMLDARLVFS